MQRIDMLLVAVAFPAVVASCAGAGALGPAEDNQISDHAAELAHCQAVGREAPDGGHIATYEACKAEAGIR